MAETLAEEDLILLFAKDHGTQFRTHAQAGDHLAGNAGNALEVARCTAADFIEDDFLQQPGRRGRRGSVPGSRISFHTTGLLPAASSYNRRHGREE